MTASNENPREWWIDDIYTDYPYNKAYRYEQDTEKIHGKTVHVIEKSYADSLKAQLDGANERIDYLLAGLDEAKVEIDRLTKELEEQSRLHGLGANREHQLLTEIEGLKKEIEQWRKKSDEGNF